MPEESVPGGDTNAGRSRRGDGGRLIVGIGASAGGLQALGEFFAHIPADSGLAFVLNSAHWSVRRASPARAAR
jgi:chemotaxis response regulator CheB